MVFPGIPGARLRAALAALVLPLLAFPAADVLAQKGPSTEAGALAALHASRGLDCATCHADQAFPDDNEAVINRQCAGCHGSYDKLGPITRAKAQNPNINAHASHLGPEIACTVCHQGHKASSLYCVGCHTNFR